MRQAGLKPKNHDSGVYWTRAMSKTNYDNKTEQDSVFTFVKIITFPLALCIIPFIWIYDILAEREE